MNYVFNAKVPLLIMISSVLVTVKLEWCLGKHTQQAVDGLLVTGYSHETFIPTQNKLRSIYGLPKLCSNHEVAQDLVVASQHMHADAGRTCRRWLPLGTTTTASSPRCIVVQRAETTSPLC